MYLTLDFPTAPKGVIVKKRPLLKAFNQSSLEKQLILSHDHGKLHAVSRLA